MKKFMDADFLLSTPTAKKLFAAANDEPIVEMIKNIKNR